MIEFKVECGSACPLGVMRHGEDEVQIAIWKPDAAECKLCLYKDKVQWKKIKLFPMTEKGMPDVFSVRLRGVGIVSELDGIEYDFCSAGHYFIDAYVKAVAGRERFAGRRGKIRGRFSFDKFDWQGENWKKLPTHQMIMYQCHVRGFTRHESSEVQFPGTFAGMQEKIPYLKKLGVNTLFLLPIYDFNEQMKQLEGTKEQKINYWGYGKDAFYFAPKASFAANKDKPALEFQKLVRELHKNGMNVVLDMYFEEKTPEFILACLRYYIIHFHIDGFRLNQDCMDTGWLREDPVISHAKLFGNGWGAQPDAFNKEKLFEMNDGFMVDARRFLKSDEGQTGKFYQQFCRQGDGVGVVHYMTQNNGFTLQDLISFDVKHNEANGEKNQDGPEINYSWNCGVEGKTRRKPILKIRKKQEKNALVMLLLGLGVPMLLAGDEFGNSQKGNNNAYCQDNLTTWLDWRLLEKNQDTFDFIRFLLEIREKHLLYHQDKKMIGIDINGVGVPDVSAHGCEPWVADFSYYSRALGILFYGSYYEGKSLYFAFNFHWDIHEFFLPDIDKKNNWKLLLDTADMTKHTEVKNKYSLAPRSICVFEKICNRSEQTDRKK